MLYSAFGDLRLSRLGFGGMRLPDTGRDGVVDEEKTFELVDYAYRNGINYFDTAFFYHGGQSERVLGKALARYPRQSFYLADKFPGNQMDLVDGKLKMDLHWCNMGVMTFDSPAEIFELQLKNCRTDYFDFYLLHNLFEGTYDLYTDEKLGIISYFLEQKKAGRIRHLGLSTHARPETIDKFLTEYDCFEFVQIQLNYLDLSLQDAGRKYDVITKHGLPVVVMEPVRGGKLAKPGEKAAALLDAASPGESPASWAFRFLQALPNVAVVLSGMTYMEHLQENIEIFNKPGTMSEAEKEVLRQVVDIIGDFVPCTACKYCKEACPQKLDIPVLIAAYNEALWGGVTWYVTDVLETLADDEKPQACIACGSCRPLCPQNIDIPGAMAGFSGMLGK